MCICSVLSKFSHLVAGHLSVRSREFPDLHRSARLEERIANQQGFRLIEAFGTDPDVAGQVRRYRREFAALSCADTAAYGASAFKESTLLQLVEVWSPGHVVIVCVIVHQKDVLGHIDLPMRLSSIVKPALG
jgi:hypothetical protein